MALDLNKKETAGILVSERRWCHLRGKHRVADLLLRRADDHNLRQGVLALPRSNHRFREVGAYSLHCNERAATTRPADACRECLSQTTVHGCSSRWWPTTQV